MNNNRHHPPPGAAATRRRPATGQAMVEMAVALVVIMVLIGGLIQVGRLARARTRTMAAARRQAGAQAFAPNYLPALDVQAITDWLPGPSGRRYTHDDRPFPAAQELYEAADLLQDHGLEAADLPWDAKARSALENPNGAAIAFLTDPGAATAGVRESVPLLSVIEILVYRKARLDHAQAASIMVEGRVRLPWLEGIY